MDLAKAQREWYKKLKDSGFKDIEYFDKDMEPRDMMYRESIKFGLTAQDKFDSVEQYYIDARSFLLTHKFKSAFDKEVWRFHAEGDSYRKTALALNTYYPKICKIVNHYKRLMLSKYKTDNNQV
jgi:hypothetical protein